ncbi:SAV_2336 N-terminal domain-related protein [Streptomyces atratus]|uniref:SAV_2336 N-terminal domain-related protein n=1 Tax=Streptomyces atratus TaxID=1893 RepID=UPI0037B0F9BE
MSDALTRLVRALSDAPLRRGTDARTLADALWLAAAGTIGRDTSPTPAAAPDETAPDPEPEPSARSAGPTPPDAETTMTQGAESKDVSVRRPGATTTVRGVPLSLGRANPLPDALAVGRALQPFRRPWSRGGRSRLDVEATVEHYARGGPLVPLFRPAPEPWFEAVVIVDASLSMSVWEETARAVTRLLTTLGGFRVVRTWRLEWQGAEPRVSDHHGREVPGERVPHHVSGAQGRRLVLLVSDCAARGWRTPAPWLLLRDWGEQIPVALLDPLPPRLWRRSALNLPAVRVTGGQVGDHNGNLRFSPPLRLRPRAASGGALGPWTALPVVSCTPRSLGAWASTLMRADPHGCDAVLVPATGRLPQTRHGTAPTRQIGPARLAEVFVHTAPAPAVRLAVLCSGLRELPLPLLHVLRDEAVPEAEYSDLAELLTSGLFAVRRDPDGDPMLVLREPAREHLRTYLTTHDRWQTRAAFTRHVATHPYAPQGIAAVLHDAWATTDIPSERRPFAEVVTAVRRAGGPVREEQASRRADGAHLGARAAGPAPHESGTGAAALAEDAAATGETEPALAAASWLREQLHNDGVRRGRRDRFTLFGHETDCHIFEGDGTRPIREEDVRIYYSPERVEFPDEIAGWRRAIEDEERRKEAAGMRYHWNSPRFAVDQLAIARTQGMQSPAVTLRLRHADYYDFLTTTLNLDRQQENGLTLRQQYLEGQDPLDAPPFLCCSFGVHVAVRTGPDRKMLFSHRSAVVAGPNQSRWNSSANEGLAANQDLGPDMRISLHAVARRALREELAIQESDSSELELLGFGLDLRNSQWGAFFSADLHDLDEEALRYRWTRGVEEKWVHDAHAFVPADPDSVLSFVMGKPVDAWAPCAPASFYLALVSDAVRRRGGDPSGRLEVEAAERRVLNRVREAAD